MIQPVDQFECDIPFITSKYRHNSNGFIKYQIAKCVKEISNHSEKALEMVVENMSFKNFRARLVQQEYSAIMLMILPSLCTSNNFLSNLKKVRDKSTFMKVIYEQVICCEEEQALVGLSCLIILNVSHKEMLQLEHKYFVNVITECILSDNDKIKKVVLSLMVTALSSWNERE